jgi:DNA repair protein RadC
MSDREAFAKVRCRGERYVATLKTVKVTLRDAYAGGDADAPMVADPVSAKELLRAVFAEAEPDQEATVFLACNCRNRVIGVKEVYRGTLDRAMVEPRNILRDALLMGAAGIIISHNHPSGDPTPSREDREFTRRLNQACEAVGIKLLDHIIIGQGGDAPGFSFRDAGLMV